MLGITLFQIRVFSWFLITPAGLAMVSSISDFGESTSWNLVPRVPPYKTKNQKGSKMGRETCFLFPRPNERPLFCALKTSHFKQPVMIIESSLNFNFLFIFRYQ